METLGLMYFPLELKAGRMQSLEEREGEGNVGWGGGSVFNVTFKEITRIYLRLKPPSK